VVAAGTGMQGAAAAGMGSYVRSMSLLISEQFFLCALFWLLLTVRRHRGRYGESYGGGSYGYASEPPDVSCVVVHCPARCLPILQLMRALSVQVTPMVAAATAAAAAATAAVVAATAAAATAVAATVAATAVAATVAATAVAMVEATVAATAAVAAMGGTNTIATRAVVGVTMTVRGVTVARRAGVGLRKFPIVKQRTSSWRH
jgi:hypothetical protein